HAEIVCVWNGREMGRPHAAAQMQFHFGQLVAHAAKTRPLCAGTIVGSGTVSMEGAPLGVACIVERRMLEKIQTGQSTTPFMKYGDTIRIEMKDEKGASIFGAIDQKIAPYKYEAQKQKKAS